jgi:hypothetical protein
MVATGLHSTNLAVAVGGASSSARLRSCPAHPREGGGPVLWPKVWVPAFAGTNGILGQG